MFRNAIVRQPCENMVNGLTEAQLGQPDYRLAHAQHREYVQALEKCGLDVQILPADNNFPDSCFVEDVALITQKVAIIARPGAPSRRDEILPMEKTLASICNVMEKIKAPGTLEAGDVMMVGDFFYIGLSQRTNKNGADQLIEILRHYGMDGCTIKLHDVLHLKTGVAYLAKKHLLAAGEFIHRPPFTQFDIIEVPEREAYAANSIWINGKVLMPSGYPKTQEHIQNQGYEVLTVNMTEYQKLDGGVSCLSLRY